MPRQDKGNGGLQNALEKDLQNSNSTTAAFLGARQRACATGERDSFSHPTFTPPNVSRSTSHQSASNNTALEVSSGANEAAQESTVLETHNRGVAGSLSFIEGDVNSPARLSNAKSQSIRGDQSREAHEPFENLPTPMAEALGREARSKECRESTAENALPSPSPSEELLTEGPQATKTPQIHGSFVATVSLPISVPVTSHAEEITTIEPHNNQQSSHSTLNQHIVVLSQDQPSPEVILKKRTQGSAIESRKKSRGQNANPAEHNAPASATTDTEAEQMGAPDFHTFDLWIKGRKRIAAQHPGRSEIELSRLTLLEDACKRSDSQYILLHQIFCSRHLYKDTGAVRDLDEMHEKGLTILGFLLASNDKLTLDALQWFAHFPNLLITTIRNHGTYTTAYLKILRCLAQIANSWDHVLNMCRSRHLPPLIDEIVGIMELESPTLQPVVFRAILRDIWSRLPDTCFARCEEILRSNQAMVMTRSARGDGPSEILASNSRFAFEYRQIWLQHQHHGQQPSNTPTHSRRNQEGAPLHIDIRAAQRPIASNNGTSPRVRTSIHEPHVHGLSRVLGPSHGPSRVSYPASGQRTPQTASFAQFPTPVQSPNTPTTISNLNRQQQPASQPMPGDHRSSQICPTTTAPRICPSNSSDASGRVLLVSNELPRNQFSHVGRYLPGPLQAFTSGSVASSSTYQAQPNPPSQPPLPRVGNVTIPNLPMAHPNTQATHPQWAMQLPQQMPQQMPASDTFLHIPARNSANSLPAQPNPAVTAIHLCQAVSPRMNTIDLNKPGVFNKCFSYVSSAYRPSSALSRYAPHLTWEAVFSEDELGNIAQDRPGPFHSVVRHTPHDSTMFRIRCVKTKIGTNVASNSDLWGWIAADTIWPDNMVILINDVALDVRRKSHFGKDLPTDITSCVKQRSNIFTAAIIGVPDDCNDQYTVGCEVIKVIEMQQLKNLIKTVPFEEARKRILDRITNEDPDIQVVRSEITLDLTDPFTSNIFETPVRGKDCRHSQCFDLDVFLETRTRKAPDEPSHPDEMRCPICKGDARPQSLTIDGFFASVRELLKRRGRLDAKAIVLDGSGQWEVKEEDEKVGESGDGTGRRRSELAGQARHGRKSSTPHHVIELD